MRCDGCIFADLPACIGRGQPAMCAKLAADPSIRDWARAESINAAIPPPPPRLHPATRLALACTEHTRDHECGCSGRRCGRSGLLVGWEECLACKAGEVGG